MNITRKGNSRALRTVCTLSYAMNRTHKKWYAKTNICFSCWVQNGVLQLLSETVRSELSWFSETGPWTVQLKWNGALVNKTHISGSVFFPVTRARGSQQSKTQLHKTPGNAQAKHSPSTTTPRTSSIIPPRWPRTTTPRIVYDLTTPALQWTLMQSSLR